MKPKTVSLSAKELSAAVQGELRGSDSMIITGLSPLQKPLPHTATFIRSRSKTALQTKLRDVPEMVILVDRSLGEDYVPQGNHSIILVRDAQQAFLDLIPLFFEPYGDQSGIHPSAIVSPSAALGKGVSIGAGSLIGDRCRIGDNSVIHNNVTLYPDVTIGARVRLHTGVVIRERCSIGDDTTIHNNVVIGADGFGYVPDPSQGIRKVPQVGTVEIGTRVEIGANTTIDRAMVGATTIGHGTKIDNQVQVGHNVQIGSHCMICAQVGIAGSVIIEDRVVLGGGAGVADHVHITSDVRVGGHSGVTSSIEEAGDYLGHPAMKAAEYRRFQITLRKTTSTKLHKKSS
jgi:UDP-3-O-[3-hydroxymyristoyl] glucosamine N-acyltransferase